MSRIPFQELPSSQTETNDASEIEEEPNSESTDRASNSANSHIVSSSLSQHPFNIWLSFFCFLLVVYYFSQHYHFHLDHFQKIQFDGLNIVLMLFFLCSRSQSPCPTWVLWCCGRSWRASWRTRASRLSPHQPSWTTTPLSSGIWCGFSAGWSCPAACPPSSLAPSTATRTFR